MVGPLGASIESGCQGSAIGCLAARGSLLQFALDRQPVGSHLRRIAARGPGPEVGDERRRTTKQEQRSPERERSDRFGRSEEHTYELASLMRTSNAVLCL